MKRFKKIYLEISNICNLNCIFCPGTVRQKRSLSEEEFSLILRKIEHYTEYLYFHLMGEPLLHPKLGRFLDISREMAFKVCITTNGTLLEECTDVLLGADCIHKLSVSLQAWEGNEDILSEEAYLDRCFKFGKKAEGRFIVAYRLWNEGGADKKNDHILARIREYFPEPWLENRDGFKIGDKVYLERAKVFDWPDISKSDAPARERYFCYGLRDQIGILADGTVVPCCLDSGGDIPLGNILTDDLEDILATPRSRAIYNGFSEGRASEKLCKNCGYATRFTK